MVALRTTIVLGLLVLLCGFVTGTETVSYRGDDCGMVLLRLDGAERGAPASVRHGCAAERIRRGVLTWGLLVAGGVALTGGWLASEERRPSRPAVLPHH